jgi:lysine 2,3-aminomutase
MARPDTYRTVEDLVVAGLLPADATHTLADVADRYAVGVTRDLASLIDRADPVDPIGLQFLPDARETVNGPGESPDPIGDVAHSPIRGIVHRHPDRVLLKVVSVCPVYCRFCFRREMVGPGREMGLSTEELAASLEYVRARPEIQEVILTGGDPFMLSARRAAALTEALEAIAHVSVIRWHTRMPVADPERVGEEFVQAIRSRTRAVYVAIHANHPREMTQPARAAIARMADAGIVLLSQSVLLKGVNDSLETLEALMRAFTANRIRPYYLHQLDAAPGTAHFRVPLAESQALVRALRDRVSGLCQPTFVVDIPGGVSKALAAPSDVELSDAGDRIRGRDGVWRDYPEPG